MRIRVRLTEFMMNSVITCPLKYVVLKYKITGGDMWKIQLWNPTHLPKDCFGKSWGEPTWKATDSKNHKRFVRSQNWAYLENKCSSGCWKARVHQNAGRILSRNRFFCWRDTVFKNARSISSRKWANLESSSLQRECWKYYFGHELK